MSEMRNLTSLRTIALLVVACLVFLPAQAKCNGGIGDDGVGLQGVAAEYAPAAIAEPARGTLLFEYYWGVDGSLGSLLALPTFPNYPDDREWRTSFEGRTDWKDNYGTCVRGYLYPPGTGDYTFWIASDDQSQLWLSKDENPAHAVQIASVMGWTPSRDFDNTGGGQQGGSQQKATSIRLTAGKRYYIEALQAEGTVGDNLAVAWQGPGIAQRVVIAGKYLAPVSEPADVTAPNLVGWWKLDETSGTTAADASGNGHDGAIQGTPTRVEGPPGFGKALYYNGQNPVAGWVNCGTWNPSASTSQLTATFWAKWGGPVGPNYWQGVVGKRNDWDPTGANQMWEFEISATSNAISFFRGDSYPNCGGRILPIGEWTHVAATFDGATLVFYIDGQETGRGAFSFGPVTDAVITIGCNNYGGSNSFNGALDDVRIYDRALLPGEIRWVTGMFQGEYFSNTTLSGGSALTRLDPQISFNWGNGEVFPGTWDNCSARWTGEIAPAYTEAYTFYVNTDDGARLWLDDNLIIDTWWDQGVTEHASQPIQLVAGQRYSIRLEYYENTGSAVCELRWSSPSTPKQVISSGRQQGPGASPGGNPSITLDPASGPVGTSVTIAGGGFVANSSGNVTFAGESKSVTTSPTGTFSTTMTVPPMPDGDYPVQADIPSGGSVEASASFTVTTSNPTPTVTVSPASGPAGTTITIAGSWFTANTPGNVTFAGTSKSVTTSPTGTFSTTMTVPSGLEVNHSYPVQADVPSGGSVEASASFTLTTSGPTPSLVLGHTTGPAGTEIGIAGKDFAGNTSGTVTLAGVSVPVTTAPAGWFTTSLTVPSVSPGTYLVQADIPSGGSVEASASFTITTGPAPEIDLTLVGGPGGSTVIAIAGVHFAANTSGRAFVDLNGDGHYDFLEPSESLTTAADGSFSTSLTVPGKTQEGRYYVMVDCPIGSPIEASAVFMFQH